MFNETDRPEDIVGEITPLNILLEEKAELERRLCEVDCAIEVKERENLYIGDTVVDIKLTLDELAYVVATCGDSYFSDYQSHCLSDCRLKAGISSVN